MSVERHSKAPRGMANPVRDEVTMKMPPPHLTLPLSTTPTLSPKRSLCALVDVEKCDCLWPPLAARSRAATPTWASSTCKSHVLTLGYICTCAHTHIHTKIPCDFSNTSTYVHAWQSVPMICTNCCGNCKRNVERIFSCFFWVWVSRLAARWKLRVEFAGDVEKAFHSFLYTIFIIICFIVCDGFNIVLANGVVQSSILWIDLDVSHQNLLNFPRFFQFVVEIFIKKLYH